MGVYYLPFFRPTARLCTTDGNTCENFASACISTFIIPSQKKDLEIDLIDQYLYEALTDYNDYNKKLLQQLLLRSLALEVTSVRQQALSSSSLQIQNNCWDHCS